MFRDDSEPTQNEPATEAMMADALPLADIEAIVRLLGVAASSEAPMGERRRAILEGLARLVDADIWLWVRNRVMPGEHLPAPLDYYDGGFVDDLERGRFLTGLVDLEISETVNPRMVSGTHRTRLMDEILKPEETALRERWARLVGMGECCVSVYPVGPQNMSAIGFHRRLGRPPFGPRERAIVHVVVGQLDFLHREGTDVPANGDALMTLSPRERQVLIYLLGGEPPKEIARKIRLSVHTVNEHIRGIYRRLNVRTRPQLMRLFLSGVAGAPPINGVRPTS